LRLYTYCEKKTERYPDFYKGDIVLDAKYKSIGKLQHVVRHDLNQLLSYMYILKARIGAFICPTKAQLMECDDRGSLNGYGGEIRLLKFPIPQTAANYSDFVIQMDLSNNILKANVKDCQVEKNNSLQLL